MLSVLEALLLRLREGEVDTEPEAVGGGVGTAESCGVKEPVSDSHALREPLALGEPQPLGEGVQRTELEAEGGGAEALGARPMFVMVPDAEGQRLTVGSPEGEAAGEGENVAVGERRELPLAPPVGEPPPPPRLRGGGLPLALREGEGEVEADTLPLSEAPPQREGDAEGKPVGAPAEGEAAIDREAVGHPNQLSPPPPTEGVGRALPVFAPPSGEALPQRAPPPPLVTEPVGEPDTEREGVVPG